MVHSSTAQLFPSETVVVFAHRYPSVLTHSLRCVCNLDWPCLDTFCCQQEASEQGNYGVRINTLCPAFVDTQLLHTVEHEETMGKFVKYKDEFKQLMDTYGILK